MGKPIATVTVLHADSLYAAQPKIYPREIGGRFARLRIVAVFALLGIFYVFPWLRWDGRQAVLFDLPARKFYIFGLTFWPQDFFWLAWLLIIAGLGLFFVTSVAGRLWCGYACPQTVWTEVFLWIERACEGRRNQRIKLDASPWNANKLLRKGGKQLAWVGLSAWTGFTFVGFFTPVTEIAREIASFDLGGWEGFWIVFYGFATYGNAGFLREQVCKYMCPYARFQSAMFDQDTLIVSYDVARGEPRGSRKRSADPKALGLGDCVDCLACVQVCPTGIDIRDGLQYECIACASCIDACDEVMDKMGYARGLVSYTTESVSTGKPRHLLRPRTLAYATLLLLLCATFVWGVGNRAPLIVEILRDRNALYRLASDGSIENSYTLKIVNKTRSSQHLHWAVVDNEHARIVGLHDATFSTDDVGSLPLTLRAEPGALSGMTRIKIAVSDDAGMLTTLQSAQFYSPETR
ncbi:MAG: cytochrome c oxidase accessory protein CcoG [Rudaea sp.]